MSHLPTVKKDEGESGGLSTRVREKDSDAHRPLPTILPLRNSHMLHVWRRSTYSALYTTTYFPPYSTQDRQDGGHLKCDTCYLIMKFLRRSQFDAK